MEFYTGFIFLWNGSGGGAPGKSPAVPMSRDAIAKCCLAISLFFVSGFLKLRLKSIKILLKKFR
jgi:hypothetical protein